MLGVTSPYDTQRIVQVNTPRIATSRIVDWMSGDEIKAARLREARAKAGYQDAAKAARAFGWGEAGYRHHENGTRDFGPDAARKYGRAYKVKAGWLLALGGVDERPPTITPTSDSLIVNASVEAGVWREAVEWNDERSFVIENMPSPIPAGSRFGLRVEGFSMDLDYQPGTVLDCISIFKNGVQPQTGDHVIAENRRADGLRELTVKELVIEDGRYFLQPRSTRPEHQGRIEVGAPSEDHFGDDGINVIAFVVNHYPPRALALLDRMGLVHPLK